MRIKNDFFDIELTTDMETGEKGAIVWFGTKNHMGAVSKMHLLAKALTKENRLKVPEHEKRKKKRIERSTEG